MSRDGWLWSRPEDNCPFEEIVRAKENEMAGCLNKVMLIGNLGKDPETRSFPNGSKVVNLRVATTESWRDRTSGERRERTEWHSVAIYAEGLQSIAQEFLRKGSSVFIEGALETRKWQDQSGADRYSTEITLRAFRGDLTMLGAKDGRGDERAQDHGHHDRSSAGGRGHDNGFGSSHGNGHRQDNRTAGSQGYDAGNGAEGYTPVGHTHQHQAF